MNNDKALKKDSSKTSFKNVKSEFKKIVWPAKETLVKQTFSVVVMSLIIGLIIFLYDTVFAAAISWLVSALS